MASLRPLPFVLAASNHGTLIVNRNDYRMTAPGRGYGVGYQILNTSSFDPSEVGFVLALLTLCRKYGGDHVFAIDCGANIGVHTVEWAKHMHGWGRVLAFEAQERVYYALAGNLAINNCLNASAQLAAVGAQDGEIRIPVPDYLVPASFGSLELRKSASNEFIGQDIDYTEANMQTVPLKAIDSYNLERLDLMKIDVEGMELDVLEGAEQTIARCKPLMTIEIIKTDKDAVSAFLERHHYRMYPLGINMLAVHETHAINQHLVQQGENLNLTV